jgi:ribosomal protein S17E
VYLFFFVKANIIKNKYKEYFEKGLQEVTPKHHNTNSIWEQSHSRTPQKEINIRIHPYITANMQQKPKETHHHESATHFP